MRELCQFGYIVAHEGGWESDGLAAFLEGQDDELEAAMYALKDFPSVLEAKQALDTCVCKEKFTQLLGAQVGIDAAGDYNTAIAARPQKVEALLHEKFIQVDVGPGLLAVNHRDLVLVLRGRPEVLAQVRVLAFVSQPGTASLRVLEQARLLGLEVLDLHLLLRDQIRICREELLAIRLENLPGRVGDDRVEAAALVEHLVELVAPVERVQRLDVGDRQRPSDRPAFLLPGRVPGGLLEANAQLLAELVEEQIVQRRVGLVPLILNAVA